MAIRFEVPADIERAAKVVGVSTLPMDWRATPGPDALKTIGSDWAKAGGSAILIVPSAVTPPETNLLLNPRHPDLRRFVMHPPEPLVFDPRLRSGDENLLPGGRPFLDLARALREAARAWAGGRI